MNVLKRRNLDRVIGKLTDAEFEGPASPEAVAAAEKALGVTFAEDYRAFLLKYGTVDSYEVELLGIAGDGLYGVVEATLEERELNDEFPKDAYVINRWGYEDIVSVQYSNGSIEAISMEYQNKKLNHSLAAYIAAEIKIAKQEEDD